MSEDAKNKIISAIKMLKDPDPRAARAHTGLGIHEFNAAQAQLERECIVVRRHSYDHSYVLGLYEPSEGEVK